LKHLALALAVVLALASCGTDTPSADVGEDPTQSQAAGEATDAPAGSTSEPAGKGEAPAVAEELRFSAETVEGDAFDGVALAGKDAILWFWAPWCTECRREAPHVAKAQAENPSVVFVGVAGLGETDDMRAFVKDYGVGAFTHLADLDGSIWQRFGVVQQPAYAFVDDTGKVELFRGELGEDGIAEHVATLTSN
jgi:thiol-disulfide isomerase/thioredoxin